ncbi:MAG: hypothetical protein V1721_02470 [Pseudomonadota bacterium]
MNKKILISLLLLTGISAAFAASPSDTSQKYTGPHGSLAEVRVASLYEKVTDRPANGGRSLEETVRVLKETSTDLIFRGFWVWNGPIPDSPDNLPPGFADIAAKRLNIKPEEIPALVRERGISYEELRNSISAIKKEMPGVIFVGAIPAQTLGRIEINPMTGKMLAPADTWKMAFDPQKWNISYVYKGKLLTKEEIQKSTAEINQETFDRGYDPGAARGYYPDITNPDFQELFLSWAEKQIDSGADAIWIDMLYSQTFRLFKMTGDIHHPAVKESYDAASKLIDGIHKYGESKGKYIYVGTWSQPAGEVPFEPPKLDFVTTTPTPVEMYSGKLDEAKWDRINAGIKEKFGNIPHFAFIDWGGDSERPIDVFSQKMTKEQQKAWLKEADKFFRSKGIIFIYPVHGGDFTGLGGAKVKAFGKFNKYDALAPEFDTFDTIKELAQNRVKRETHEAVP